jgi:transposase
MARPPMFSAQAKQRIVLSVLRGEMSVAEAARRNKCSETSVAKWRDQFVQAGAGALEASAARGPSTREAQLERELAEVTSALGEAHDFLDTGHYLRGPRRPPRGCRGRPSSLAHASSPRPPAIARTMPAAGPPLPNSTPMECARYAPPYNASPIACRCRRPGKVVRSWQTRASSAWMRSSVQ